MSSEKFFRGDQGGRELHVLLSVKVSDARNNLCFAGTRGTNREGGGYGASNKCVIYEWRFRPPVITSPSRGRAGPARIPSSELRARVLWPPMKGRASPSAEIIFMG
jgi:hypothetical protein